MTGSKLKEFKVCADMEGRSDAVRGMECNLKDSFEHPADRTSVAMRGMGAPLLEQEQMAVISAVSRYLESKEELTELQLYYEGQYGQPGTPLGFILDSTGLSTREALQIIDSLVSKQILVQQGVLAWEIHPQAFRYRTHA
jgi:hypothetical protein